MTVEAKEAGGESPLGRRLISLRLGIGISSALLVAAVALPTHWVYSWNPPVARTPESVWLLSHLGRFDYSGLQALTRAAFFALLALTAAAPVVTRLSLPNNLWTHVLVLVLLEIATLALGALLAMAWVFRNAFFPASAAGLIGPSWGTWALIGATATQWVLWWPWAAGFVRKIVHPKRYPHRYDNVLTDGLRWAVRNPGKSLPVTACGLQLMMVACMLTSAVRFGEGLTALAVLKMLVAACVASLAAWGVMALIMRLVRGPAGVGMAILAGAIVVLLGWGAIQAAAPVS